MGRPRLTLSCARGPPDSPLSLPLGLAWPRGRGRACGGRGGFLGWCLAGSGACLSPRSAAGPRRAFLGRLARGFQAGCALPPSRFSCLSSSEEKVGLDRVIQPLLGCLVSTHLVAGVEGMAKNARPKALGRESGRRTREQIITWLGDVVATPTSRTRCSGVGLGHRGGWGRGRGKS